MDIFECSECSMTNCKIEYKKITGAGVIIAVKTYFRLMPFFSLYDNFHIKDVSNNLKNILEFGKLYKLNITIRDTEMTGDFGWENIGGENVLMLSGALIQRIGE